METFATSTDLMSLSASVSSAAADEIISHADRGKLQDGSSRMRGMADVRIGCV